MKTKNKPKCTCHLCQYGQERCQCWCHKKVKPLGDKRGWEHATLKNPCYCFCHENGDENECPICKKVTKLVAQTKKETIDSLKAVIGEAYEEACNWSDDNAYIMKIELRDKIKKLEEEK